MSGEINHAVNGAGTDAEARPQTLDAWFLDLLACPACPQHLPLHLVPLGEDGKTLNCQCGRYAFPVRDGLPILLVEEAALINPDATPDAVTAHPAES